MNIYEVKSEYDKKLKSIMIVGAIAGVVLLIAGIFAFRSLKETNVDTENVTSQSVEAEDVVHNVVLLNKKFAYLLQLDENYAVMLGTPGVNMDSADHVILNEENEFLKTLGAVQKNSVNLNSMQNRKLVDSLTAAFRSAIVNRRYLADIRKSFNGKKLTINSSDKQVYKLQIEIQRKNAEIASLEKRKNAPAEAQATGPQTEEFENALKQEEMRNTGLIEETNTLKEENEQLKSEVRQIRQSLVVQENKKSEKNRYEQMQEQIEDMNAELNFAQVDCSLMRADVNKIISNSKQRRQILTEALQALKNLSLSENPTVQNKAKAKLDELNQIASNIRE